MSEHILVETKDGIAVIRMQRPEKKNAISLAMYLAMIEALGRADADPSTRVAVILGAEGVFSAGNDIGDFVRVASSGGDLTPPLRFLHALSGFSKPVVAGVNGLAIGIGVTLLLHCDLAYASPGARFKTPFVDLGLTPEGGSSLLLPQLLGHRGAAQWLLLGDEADAEAARQAGLINAVVERADEAALAAAARLAQKPPTALVEAKRLMKRTLAAQVAETIDFEGRVFAERLRSPEALAALMSFKKK